EMARSDPSLRDRQPYKAALERDMAFLHEQGERAALEILAETHADLPQEEFERLANSYAARARHPALDAPVVDLAYLPMVELMDHLRDNGFDVYICSGGGADFVRAFSERMYGVPSGNVMGSTLVY